MGHYFLISGHPAATLNFGFVMSSTSAGSVHTSTAINIGAAAADRYVIAAVAYNSATAILGVTIGGIAATNIVSVGSVGLWAAIVPTGTTAVFEITTASSIAGIAVGCYYGTGIINPLVPVDTASQDSTGTVHNLPLDVRGNGIIVAASGSEDGPASFVDIVEDADFAVGLGDPNAYAIAGDTIAPGESSRAVSVTWATSTPLRSVAASFY